MHGAMRSGGTVCRRLWFRFVSLPTVRSGRLSCSGTLTGCRAVTQPLILVVVFLVFILVLVALWAGEVIIAFLAVVFHITLHGTLTITRRALFGSLLLTTSVAAVIATVICP